MVGVTAGLGGRTVFGAEDDEAVTDLDDVDRNAVERGEPLAGQYFGRCADGPPTAH